MSGTEGWLHPVGWALIHFLWQGAAIAALAWLALRAARASAPGVRYAVATAALCAMTAAPLATAAWLAPAGGGRDPATATGEVGAPGWRVVQVPLGRSGAAGTEGAARPSAATLARRASLALEPLVPGLVSGWAAGVLLLSLRLLGGWLWLQRLARSSRVAVPAAWAECLDGLRRALGIRRRVGLFLSPHVHGPALVGWLRPVILLPLSASSGLTPRQVELLLLHELVHVRRWDYAVNLLQRVAETLLFYHPGVWWLSARIREEREHCCDDAVVARSGVREYVLALLAMEEVRRPVPELALGAGGASLLARVRRLVEPGAGATRKAEPRAALGVALPALLALAATLGPGPERAAAVAAARGDAAPAVCAAGAGAGACAELARAADGLLRRTGRPGAVIVQEVATGAVLALSQASTGADTVDVARPLLPASLWKLAIAAAWWERGWGSEAMACPASARVGGVTVRSPGGAGEGPLTVPEGMLVHSCNTAAVEMALRLGRDGGAARLAGELRAMGFPVARPGERPAPDPAFWAASAAPAPAAPLGATVRMGEGSPAALAELALGMERARITPLHLSRFLQAVGNGGVMRAPVPASGSSSAAGGEPGTRVMSAATAAKLQGAMMQAVDHGTARAAAGTQPGAWRLGGKTGTTGGRAGGAADGWFAGLVFDGAGRPRYTVLTYLRGGGPGGEQPTRLAAEVARVLTGREAR